MIKVEDYNKLDLVTRASLTMNDLLLDVETASIEDRALARSKQVEAVLYINNNRALVAAGKLNRMYAELMKLAYDAEDIAEIRHKITLRYLQQSIAKLCYGYGEVLGKISELLKKNKTEE